MKRFFVITNESRDRNCEKARQITDHLNARGAACSYVSIERDSDETSSEVKAIDELPDDTDAVIVLGGDGTFIQSAGIIAPKKIPMIGINLGHLGYLAEVDKEKITPALDRLLNDDYTIEDRIMLSGTPVIAGKEAGSFYAFNDIVVRTPGSSVGYFEIEVNGTYLTTISGDGLIIATPTGSTAYNMSAGGPIIEPGSSTIVLTPICPLELESRSVVLSAENTVVIKLIRPEGRRRKTAGVYFDGGEEISLSSDDSVCIKKASSAVRLIKLSKESFLEVLSRKMQRQ